MFPEMQLWLKIVLALVVAVILAFATTPPVKRFAEKVGAIDVPKDARRVHKKPIPRMGGMAIFIGFLLAVLLFAEIDKSLRGTLIGCLIIVATGAIDDIKPMKWWVKLICQVLAAVVAVAHGVTINVLFNPNILSDNTVVFLGALSIPITIIWIVAITNAVNLIDGLDGLACGVSCISSITMLVVALILSEGNIAVVLAALVGACIGFLPYNANPAKIFMGDTGALLLGFALSTISVSAMFKFYAIITFVVPMLAMALPLFDTLFAIIRRLLKGQSPMTPDRGHLHHRLIDMGLSQKQAVAILYCLSAVLGLTAVVINTHGPLRITLLIAELLLAVFIGFFVKNQIEHPANTPHKEDARPSSEPTE